MFSFEEYIKNKFPEHQYLWFENAENVAEFYSKAWISIIPGFKRDGPLIKFIESVYFETPVVCTQTSLNGYEIFNKDEMLIPASDDAEEFVNHIKLLLNDEISLNIRANKLKIIADENFSMRSILKNLEA